MNQAADALSHHSKKDNDNSSDNKSEEYETISYAVVCGGLCEIIKGEKLPLDIKSMLQTGITKQASRKVILLEHSAPRCHILG